MKKRNPIKDTVTHYVAASVRVRAACRRMSMREFFEDLENRGPFKPNSLFEQITKQVREDMEEAGTWIRGEEDCLDFVAEYISRILQEYNKYLGQQGLHMGSLILKRGRFAGYQEHFLEFRKIYLKIRTWGLRTKRFRLRKWRLVQYPFQFDFCVNLWPLDYQQKCAASEPTFRYRTFPFISWREKYGFFQKDELPEGKNSKNYRL